MTASNAAGTSRLLAIYLRNHAAAARGGADLFARMASSQATRPWGAELTALAREISEDCQALRAVLRSLGVRPPTVATLVVRAGERVGRLKPNGAVVHRSPLSDLIEVEAGLDAVHAKAAGWEALRAAGVPVGTVDLDDLLRRAADQLDRLRRLHATVAARTL